MPADISAVTAIYGHHVATGLASFELQPPSVAEMTRRYEELVERGFPYLVAERAGKIVGYAYAGAYRARPAYRFSVENSVYIDPDARRGGVGRALLQALIDECERRGFRQMVAVIGDSDNAASIGLHAVCGFKIIGTLPSIGYKFERWVDSVFMQRALGEGSATPPACEDRKLTDVKRCLKTENALLQRTSRLPGSKCQPGSEVALDREPYPGTGK